MALKRTAADIAVSNFVRERDGWKCRRCNTYYPEGRRGALDNSHFFGRANQSTRFYTVNCFTHCRGCHQYLSSRPHEFTEWVQDQLGDEDYWELVRRAREIKKRPKTELKEIAAHFRAQTEYLKRCQKEGKKFVVVEWD